MHNEKEKKKARQDEVYAVAARLFATQGYHATRIQDIADELGILKGSLYYYFSSKEDLLARVTEGYVEEIYGAIEAIVNTGYSPVQKLTLAIDEHLRLYQENAYIYAIFTQENLTTIDHDTAVAVDNLNKQYVRLWAQILQEGVEQDDFRADLDTTIIARAILGMCNHILFWYDPDGRLPIRELARIYTQLILNGVQTPR